MRICPYFHNDIIGNSIRKITMMERFTDVVRFWSGVDVVVIMVDVVNRTKVEEKSIIYIYESDISI